MQIRQQAIDLLIVAEISFGLVLQALSKKSPFLLIGYVYV